MQRTQKHAFWRITRQNRSNGLTPSGAKEQTKNKKIKKAQTINISPLRGDHAPEPIDMPFSVLTLVTDVIIPAKFYVDPLKGFWEGAPPKVPLPILFGTTVTTVLHYRADCDLSEKKWCYGLEPPMKCRNGIPYCTTFSSSSRTYRLTWHKLNTIASRTRYTNYREKN